MTIYSITNNTINERYADGFASIQQAVWYLISHTSKSDRDCHIYQVWHYDDNNNVVIDWSNR